MKSLQIKAKPVTHFQYQSYLSVIFLLSYKQMKFCIAKEWRKSQLMERDKWQGLAKLCNEFTVGFPTPEMFIFWNQPLGTFSIIPVKSFPLGLSLCQESSSETSLLEIRKIYFWVNLFMLILQKYIRARLEQHVLCQLLFGMKNIVDKSSVWEFKWSFHIVPKVNNETWANNLRSGILKHVKAKKNILATFPFIHTHTIISFSWAKESLIICHQAVNSYQPYREILSVAICP